MNRAGTDFDEHGIATLLARCKRMEHFKTAGGVIFKWAWLEIGLASR